MLQGAHILIIEDEPLIALDVETAVRLAGAGLVSAAQTVEQALTMVEAPGLAGAIVDLRLQGQSVREVVKRLTERSIPFIFYTGADDIPTARSWPAVPVVSKPAAPQDAVCLLAQLIAKQ
ncbi:MAG: response regulator [Hyphomicrobium sp.]